MWHEFLHFMKECSRKRENLWHSKKEKRKRAENFSFQFFLFKVKHLHLKIHFWYILCLFCNKKEISKDMPTVVQISQHQTRRQQHGIKLGCCRICTCEWKLKRNIIENMYIYIYIFFLRHFFLLFLGLHLRFLTEKCGLLKIFELLLGMEFYFISVSCSKLLKHAFMTVQN